MMGSSRRAAPAPFTGALPLISLMVAVVVVCWSIEIRSLMMGRVDEVNESATVFSVVEARACDEEDILMEGDLNHSYM
jgi:hypothetical protein